MRGKPEIDELMKPVQEVIGKLPYGKPVPYDVITQIWNRAYEAVWAALDGAKQ